MKSTKNERTASEDEYPCLKTDEDGLVVLFTDIETGTVVSHDHTFDLGYYSRDWAERDFTLYHGTITLEQ